MLNILPVTVLPLASVTTIVSTVVGTVAVTGLPLASKIHSICFMYVQCWKCDSLSVYIPHQSMFRSINIVLEEAISLIFIQTLFSAFTSHDG